MSLDKKRTALDILSDFSGRILALRFLSSWQYHLIKLYSQASPALVLGTLVVALGVATVLSSVTLPKVGGGKHRKPCSFCEIMSVMFDGSCGLVRCTAAHRGDRVCGSLQASAMKYLPR